MALFSKVCAVDFRKTNLLGKCLFHHEMFNLTNFRLVLDVCIAHMVIFGKDQAAWLKLKTNNVVWWGFQPVLGQYIFMFYTTILLPVLWTNLFIFLLKYTWTIVDGDLQYWKNLISYGSTYQGQIFEPRVVVLVCILLPVILCNTSNTRPEPASWD